MRKIFYAIIAVTALGLVACGSNTDNKAEGHNNHHATAETTNPNAILDPVCKMEKTDQWVDSASSHGQMFYFCSPVCKEQFEKDPHKFMDAHSH